MDSVSFLLLLENLKQLVQSIRHLEQLEEVSKKESGGGKTEQKPKTENRMKKIVLWGRVLFTPIQRGIHHSVILGYAPSKLEDSGT